MSTPSREALDYARTMMAQAQAKAAQLANINPYFIDLSLRENPFGSNVGQTIDEKKLILQQVRDFGFTNILFGTLDYALPDEKEVDDDFMSFLKTNGWNMNGGFAFTDIGLVQDGVFTPSPSMIKLAEYGVPNTLHEIYLSREGMATQPYDLAMLQASLPATIAWLKENITGDYGGPPRIIINIVDGCDAFMEDDQMVCGVLAQLADLGIEGVSIEDDRGTYMPFQVGAFVAIARNMLPAPLKLLVHMHSGGGFENASVIEALLNGADGVWGGLPKRAAIIGHASLGELIANLMRVGNGNMAATYQVKSLLPLATSFQLTDDDASAIPDDLPILGANAYRLTLDFFRQLPTRQMDLVPEAIGGTYGYRVAPLGSDAIVLAGRLSEVTGLPPETFPAPVLEMMIRLMRRDLRAGTRIVYDEPSNLIDLYQRAGGERYDRKD